MMRVIILLTITLGISSCHKQHEVKDFNFFWIEKDYPSDYGKVGIYFAPDSIGYPFELDKDEFITSFYYGRCDYPCQEISCNNFEYVIDADTITMENTNYLYQFTEEDTLMLYSLNKDWPVTRKFYKDGKNTMKIRQQFKLK